MVTGVPAAFALTVVTATNRYKPPAGWDVRSVSEQVKSMSLRFAISAS